MVIFGKILVLVLAICALAMTSGATWAQNQTPNKVWIQVDAQRTLPQAEARATLYESSFPNLKGYRLDTDWYVLAIGPFKKDEANKLLAQFIYASKIPMDSYVTKGLNFTEVFWPRPEGELPLSAAATPKSQMPQALEAADSETPVVNAATPMASAVTPAPRSVAKPTLVKPNFNDQDLERARASLDALSTDKKRQIQNALRWFGTYLGPIDGQIGSGSRKSIEEWQKAQGIDPTGALTPNQRTWLLANFDLEAAELGWEKVTDTQAGITFSQPRNLVHFSNYEPPFARYMPLNGGQTNLSLISQSGDRSELRQLFNVLRDLEAVPKDADAGLSDHGFIIQGMGSGRYVSIYAQLIDNTIKGFALFTPTRPDKSERRIAAFLKRSFTPSSSDVLRDDIA
ncbi:MAG: peptidoglycan-binding protein, partial [Paracoccaceae bacterium]